MTALPGDDFYKLSKALKAAGRKGMRNDLNASMRRAAKPLVKVAQRAAFDTFPKHGGMAEREALTPFVVRTYTGATDHGVKIVAPGRYVAGGSVNRNGAFRHPVYGKAKNAQGEDLTRRDWTWRTQEVPGGAGWFDRAMEGSAPLVRPELEQALADIVDDILRGARGR